MLKLFSSMQKLFAMLQKQFTVKETPCMTSTESGRVQAHLVLIMKMIRG
jgi:hypothetical protein